MKCSMPRPLFNTVLSLSVPRCSDTWQCCNHYLAMLLQAPYCRERSSPYWLSDQCDLQSSLFTPKVIKHIMLVLSNASEEWSGAIAFCLLQANHIKEMRNQMAVCLQVCMCTRAYWFLQGYVSLLGFASWAAGDVKGAGYDSHGCVQWARISLRCSLFANAKSVLMFVSLQLRLRLPFLYLRMTENVPPIKQTFDTSLDQLISNFSFLSPEPWM